MEEEEQKDPGEVSTDALEAVFTSEEVIVLEGEGDERPLLVEEEEDEDDSVDFAYYEDEGHW